MKDGKRPWLIHSLMLMLVVLAQNVASKVTFEIAPDGVDVIPLVLNIVVLDEEGGTLNAVVMFAAYFGRTGPGEGNILYAGISQNGQSRLGHIRWHIVEILINDRF